MCIKGDEIVESVCLERRHPSQAGREDSANKGLQAPEKRRALIIRTMAEPVLAVSTALCIASAVAGKASPRVPVTTATQLLKVSRGSCSAEMKQSAKLSLAPPKPTNWRSPSWSYTTSTSRVGLSTVCTALMSTPLSAGQGPALRVEHEMSPAWQTLADDESAAQALVGALKHLAAHGGHL